MVVPEMLRVSMWGWKEVEGIKGSVESSFNPSSLSIRKLVLGYHLLVPCWLLLDASIFGSWCWSLADADSWVNHDGNVEAVLEHIACRL